MSPKTQRMLNREINAMDTLRHPNIIRLYEVIETLGRIHLVVEYASGGELFAHITSEGQLPEPKAKKVFAQVVAAVQHMHRHNFIHRDIKAENVFLASNGNVKVGDLGFSTHVQSKDCRLTTFCGSPPYAAPELFQDSSYTGPQERILDGSYPDPEGVSKPCLELIRGMLEKSPKDRLSLEAVRGSRWLGGEALPYIGGEPFWSSPTKSDNYPEIEAKARNRLEELGVKPSMLSEHASNGSRSQIIGVYRIVVQMFLRKAEEEEAAARERDAGKPEEKEVEKKKGQKCSSGQFKTKWGSGGMNCVSMGSGHSKTCTIL
ncbi:hypothetical protein J437_LFUL002038 [Ladona fulva]|uniref:Protein kinase domain-containing protein n=1 Tax=Ladona fulva TaxID=123851 RepID=A0A8K0JUU9_LADFU|nr:hypothetical protein J437_LFUL002038 [Ladona fulva]